MQKQKSLSFFICPPGSVPALLIFFLACLFKIEANAQGQLTVPHSGGNRKATVSELLGLTKLELTYNRPGVRGREGKIWGTNVVHYGLKNQGFGSSKAAPWRAGANENTTFLTSSAVNIEGQRLSPGKYGVFMIAGENQTTVIFSRNSGSWGSFFYDSTEDALRVTVKNEKLSAPVEWLKYEFIRQTDTSVTVALMWENRLIPFTITADVYRLQLESFRQELRTEPGFIWQSYEQAASYCLMHNIEFEQGLVWAEESISGVVGQKNFKTLSTKAALLAKLNRTKESELIMKEAIPMGNLLELHEYAKSLLKQNNGQAAFEVFNLNYRNHPDQLTTNIGLARGYAALGNFKLALKYMRSALKQVPNESSATIIRDLITKLEARQNIN